MDIEKFIENITHPKTFVTLFEDMEAFRDWVGTGNKKEIAIVLDLFVSYELFEYCVIIKEELEKKIT
jgi:hypothetical protein